VAGGTVAVTVARLLSRQEPVECVDQVRVRARADLDDDEARRGVRDEDQEEPVACPDFLEEGLARRGEVREAAARDGPDRQLARVYGKMLRNASRRRPSPPRAGADS
jgi:hypothetical protein